jgi:hypothetical protein
VGDSRGDGRREDPQRETAPSEGPCSFLANSSTPTTTLPKPSKNSPVVTLPLFLIFYPHVSGRQRQPILLSKQRSGAGSRSHSYMTGNLRSRKGNSIAHQSHPWRASSPVERPQHGDSRMSLYSIGSSTFSGRRFQRGPSLAATIPQPQQPISGDRPEPAVSNPTPPPPARLTSSASRTSNLNLSTGFGKTAAPAP